MIYLLQSQKVHINIIGDSLSQRSEGFYLQEKLGYGFQVNDYSVSGRTTREWIADISRPFQITPNIVILEIGTNDAMSMDSLEFQNNYFKLLQEIAMRTSGKIFLTKIPLTDNISLRTIIKENNQYVGSIVGNSYYLVDLEALFEENPYKERLYPVNDFVHPSDWGYDIIGEAYKKEIIGLQ
ncbi:MAG: SGNH/GDSL hydrolase family protein [Leptospiraceae bacterium]|nr:SGNH/GDSL hydrolase family protein [Leptospiraceae bacterium]